MTHLKFPMTRGCLSTQAQENSPLKHLCQAKCHASVVENVKASSPGRIKRDKNAESEIDFGICTNPISPTDQNPLPAPPSMKETVTQTQCGKYRKPQTELQTDF